jgi:hypothetical protein
VCLCDLGPGSEGGWVGWGGVEKRRGGRGRRDSGWEWGISVCVLGFGLSRLAFTPCTRTRGQHATHTQIHTHNPAFYHAHRLLAPMHTRPSPPWTHMHRFTGPFSSHAHTHTLTDTCSGEGVEGWACKEACGAVAELTLTSDASYQVMRLALRTTRGHTQPPPHTQPRAAGHAPSHDARSAQVAFRLPYTSGANAG